MLTVDTFRTSYVEFSDTDQYSDAIVGFWLGISQSLVNPLRWTDLTDLAVGLATAHQIVIANQNAAGGGAAGNAGGKLGPVVGPVTAKMVGNVSVSNDPSAVTLTDGGFWNMSTYGIQFLQLARMFGSGPVQL